MAMQNDDSEFVAKLMKVFAIAAFVQCLFSTGSKIAGHSTIRYVTLSRATYSTEPATDLLFRSCSVTNSANYSTLCISGTRGFGEARQST